MFMATVSSNAKRLDELRDDFITFKGEVRADLAAGRQVAMAEARENRDQLRQLTWWIIGLLVSMGALNAGLQLFFELRAS